MARPGIMIYFDILEPIQVLPDEDKGRLLVAMLEYGKDGIVPEFQGMLSLAWGFVRPKLDRDFEEYKQSVLRRRYATVCRERKKKGEPEISFDDWAKTVDGQNASMMTNDDQWYPTTTGTPTGTPAAAVSPKSKGSISPAAAVTGTPREPEEGLAAAAAEIASSELKIWGGELGKNVVLLTDEQTEDLLNRMGLDLFDHYVDKLSTFIIRNNAKVASHYQTILKWWKQDCGIEES